MEVLAAALIGLALGSFATVLIVRLPEDRDWVRERSACPQCGKEIAWYDNVPVVSWLVLRGRCRSCNNRVPVMYPLTEVVVALGSVGLLWWLGPRPLTAGLIVLWMATVVWVVIDIRVRRLPDAVTAMASVAMVLAVVADSALWTHALPLLGALWGVLVLGGAYFLLWFVYPAGMGFGDVKVAALLGIPLGYLGWNSLAVGSIAGPLIGGVVVVLGLATGRLSRKSAVPYGPALLAGAWVGILAGDQIARSYVALVTG